jgi:PPOX class probable F420-dependent enzyme
MFDFGPITMTRAEVHAFLGAEFKTDQDSLKAALATLRKDGSPHVVPVGFWYDGQYLYITLSPTRLGVKRLRRDPRVSVSVFRHRSPAIFVTVSGKAEEIDDPGHAISRRILRRYPRPAGWDVEAFEKNWLEAGKVVFRIPMHEVAGMNMSKADDLVAVAQSPADKALIRERNTKGRS